VGEDVVPGQSSWHAKPHSCQNGRMSIPAQIQIGVIRLANYLIKGAIGSRLVIENHTFFGFLNSNPIILQQIKRLGLNPIGLAIT
jgi:hypothetical protein